MCVKVWEVKEGVWCVWRGPGVCGGLVTEGGSPVCVEGAWCVGVW